MPYHADIHPSVDPIVNSSEAGPKDLMGQVSLKGMHTRRHGAQSGTYGLVPQQLQPSLCRADNGIVRRIELNRQTYVGDLPAKIGPEASLSLWRAYLCRVESFAAAGLAILLFGVQAVLGWSWMKWVALGLILLPIPLCAINLSYLRRYRRRAIRFSRVDPNVRGRIPHSSPAFERWRDSHQVSVSDE